MLQTLSRQVGPSVVFHPEAESGTRPPLAPTTDQVTTAAALAANCRSFKVGNLTINIFPASSMLEHNVAQQLKREFQEPGLIILPADSTHGHESGRADGNIYRLVNEHFAMNQPHSALRVTHMDELKNSPEKFSNKLQSWLPNIIGTGTNSIGTRFHAIDPENLDAYTQFVNEGGGARVIVGGVGAEEPPHLAYIGEKQAAGQPVLNDQPELVPLRTREAGRRGVTHAATMGMSFFNSPKLESVIISAKGEHKAKSVAYALREGLLSKAPQGKSAFGEIIRRFADSATTGQKGNLVLNFDQTAFAIALHDPDLQRKFKGS